MYLVNSLCAEMARYMPKAMASGEKTIAMLCAL
eukprot:CAMPEP_0117562302 /NCGR_PEP_ID=MMETSP0784-20121206/54887_1 /TAXON_ID=39447 /ORGANISM="" /LENGTH=32 /DNA_ID= /DNA_START= /DNA_END= /DNA_ORIENTATION=